MHEVAHGKCSTHTSMVVMLETSLSIGRATALWVDWAQPLAGLT